MVTTVSLASNVLPWCCYEEVISKVQELSGIVLQRQVSVGCLDCMLHPDLRQACKCTHTLQTSAWHLLFDMSA